MPDIGDYNGTMGAYWDGHQWIPAEVWEDEASRAARMIPPDPWWKRMLRTLGVGVAIVGILGALSATCYGLSQIPGCKSIPVSDAEVRQDARKLGKKALSCKNVKVYITGKWRDRAYVAVVGCKKKVMLNCRTRAGTCARGCKQESDVMPGTELNVKRRDNGTGKYHSTSWELSP